jgi:prophage regulatory protein
MVTPQSRTRRASSAGTEDRTGDTRPSMTQATRLLRLPAVREATGLGPTKLYELIGAGQFPRPVVLARTCSGKPRTVAWPEHEVRAWLPRESPSAMRDLAAVTRAARMQAENALRVATALPRRGRDGRPRRRARGWHHGTRQYQRERFETSTTNWQSLRMRRMPSEIQQYERFRSSPYRRPRRGSSLPRTFRDDCDRNACQQLGILDRATPRRSTPEARTTSAGDAIGTDTDSGVGSGAATSHERAERRGLTRWAAEANDRSRRMASTLRSR